MEQVLSFVIIGTAIFVWYSLRKFKQKPYIVNFSISAMLLLIIWRTSLMYPLDGFSIVVLIICSIACIMQIILGIKNITPSESDV